MGSHKTVSGSTSPIQPTPPVADYNVTGTLIPDSTCNYFYAGEYDGYHYYRRVDGLWFIWHDIDRWVITDELGNHDRPFWATNEDFPITGPYEPQNEAEGISTVSMGPH